MEGDPINWTSVLVAFAAPVLSFLGLVFQCVFAGRSKNDKTQQTEGINKRIDESNNIARKSLELAQQNREDMKIVVEHQQANDVATVTVVRQSIREMYYSLRDKKVISDTDYRALNEMYNAYKGVTLPDGHHPNSWCDALYEEMCGWERVETYPGHRPKKQ